MEMKAYFKTEFNVYTIYIIYHLFIDFFSDKTFLYAFMLRSRNLWSRKK